MNTRTKKGFKHLKQLDICYVSMSKITIQKEAGSGGVSGGWSVVAMKVQEMYEGQRVFLVMSFVRPTV